MNPAAPVVALLALGCALHLGTAPLLATLVMGGAAALAVLLPRRVPDPARRRLWVAVAGLVLAALTLSVLTWSSGTAIALLLGAAGWLKLAEGHDTRRDRFVVLLAALWLTALGMLRLQPGAALLVLAFTLALLMAALAETDRRAPPRPGAVFATLAPLAALTAVLFVFTPRITGNLGHLAFALDLPLVIETSAEAARNPMQQGLALGDIADRAAAGNGDMRVLVANFYAGSGDFLDGAPPLGDLYWRGPVLWRYADGRWNPRDGWESRKTRLRGKFTPRTLDRELAETGQRSVYDVSLFPHRGEWLYALDFPAYAPPSGYITRDWQLLNLNPVREMLKYAMISYADYKAGLTLDADTRALALALPAGEEPATQAAGRALRAAHGADAEAVARAGMAHFARGFRYDKGAPRHAGANPVDAFLTGTRRGYGMHFASAYTLMMRAAGVPARVVAGYRGGMKLGLTERVLVLEEHAHAWAEIWLADRGWVRVDPAAGPAAAQRAAGDGWGLAGMAEDLAPETPPEPETDPDTGAEAESGGNAVLADGQGPSPGESGRGPGAGLAGFDTEAQRRLLRAGGLPEGWAALVGAGLGLIALGAAAVAGALALRHWFALRRLPPARRLALALSRRMARRGLSRRPQEGLRAWAARLRASGRLTEAESRALDSCVAWMVAALYGDCTRPAPPSAAAFAGTAPRWLPKF